MSTCAVQGLVCDRQMLKEDVQSDCKRVFCKEFISMVAQSAQAKLAHLFFKMV